MSVVFVINSAVARAWFPQRRWQELEKWQDSMLKQIQNSYAQCALIDGQEKNWVNENLILFGINYLISQTHNRNRVLNSLSTIKIWVVA